MLLCLYPLTNYNKIEEKDGICKLKNLLVVYCLTQHICCYMCISVTKQIHPVISASLGPLHPFRPPSPALGFSLYLQVWHYPTGNIEYAHDESFSNLASWFLVTSISMDILFHLYAVTHFMPLTQTLIPPFLNDKFRHPTLSP